MSKITDSNLVFIEKNFKIYESFFYWLQLKIEILNLYKIVMIAKPIVDSVLAIVRINNIKI
jgi:hypothetical protein